MIYHPVQVAEPLTPRAKAKPGAEAEQEARILRPGPSTEFYDMSVDDGESPINALIRIAEKS